MEIERLSFLISPKDRVDDFIVADTKVWEPWLQQQRGYLRKQYQRYPTGRVDIRIFWDSKKHSIISDREDLSLSVKVLLDTFECCVDLSIVKLISIQFSQAKNA